MRSPLFNRVEDPDEQVRPAVRDLFAQFQRTAVSSGRCSRVAA